MEREIHEEETGSRPAPGDLALVQAFVNTVDIESGEEQLATPGALEAWLRSHGLLVDGPSLTDADLRLAIPSREALRALAYANHEGEPDPAALSTLDRVAATARLRMRFDQHGPRLEPELPGIDGALGRLLSIVYASMVEGSWSRLKACRRDTCRWAFYDRSRNRTSSWCTMAVCGNREKARAYRLRRRQEA